MFTRPLLILVSALIVSACSEQSGDTTIVNQASEPDAVELVGFDTNPFNNLVTDLGDDYAADASLKALEDTTDISLFVWRVELANPASKIRCRVIRDFGQQMSIVGQPLEDTNLSTPMVKYFLVVPTSPEVIAKKGDTPRYELRTNFRGQALEMVHVDLLKVVANGKDHRFEGQVTQVTQFVEEAPKAMPEGISPSQPFTLASQDDNLFQFELRNNMLQDEMGLTSFAVNAAGPVSSLRAIVNTQVFQGQQFDTNRFTFDLRDANGNAQFFASAAGLTPTITVIGDVLTPTGTSSPKTIVVVQLDQYELVNTHNNFGIAFGGELKEASGRRASLTTFYNYPGTDPFRFVGNDRHLHTTTTGTTSNVRVLGLFGFGPTQSTTYQFFSFEMEFNTPGTTVTGAALNVFGTQFTGTQLTATRWRFEAPMNFFFTTHPGTAPGGTECDLDLLFSSPIGNTTITVDVVSVEAEATNGALQNSPTLPPQIFPVMQRDNAFEDRFTDMVFKIDIS